MAPNSNTSIGVQGFAVLARLREGSQPIFFCGVTLFLPHPDYLVQRKSTDRLLATIQVDEHTVSQIGPTGKEQTNWPIKYLRLSWPISIFQFGIKYFFLLDRSRLSQVLGFILHK